MNASPRNRDGGAADAFEFGSYRLEPASRQLYRDGARVPLTPKAIDTLLALIERRGQVVSKDELLERIWAGRAVEDQVLTQNIYTLRRAIPEVRGAPVIETVPRLGYRFLPAVRRVRSETPLHSLAILPFVPLGAGEEGDVLGLAMADALIARLARRKELLVRPTAAVQGLGGVEASTAARELAVDGVVTGTVQSAGGRLRVAAQLLRAGGNAPIWSTTCDGHAEELFELQDRLFAELAPPLGLRDADARRPARVHPEAYREYVRGRFFWNKRAGAELERAIASFERAIELDPSFARAHAGLADALVLLPLYADGLPSDSFPQATAAAQRALELDPELAAAHATLAYSDFLYHWDWKAAESGFRRALDLAPGYATAHHWYSFFLSAMGRHEEAINRAARAVEHDPLSLVINTDVAFVYYFAGALEEALTQLAATRELDEGFAYSSFALAFVHCRAGRRDEALAAAREAVLRAPENGANLAALGYVCGEAGLAAEATRILEELRSRPRSKANLLALVYLGLGRFDEALEALEHAAEARSRFVVFLRTWPLFEPLRSLPRFERLIARVGLPPAPA